MTKPHPGFKNVQAHIASTLGDKGGFSSKRARAGAILAARTRAASPAAKERNPRLRRVLGGG